MTKHTPGPWKAVSYSKESGAHILIVDERNDIDVCVVDGSFTARREPNARLIAQAPAMAEALSIALHTDCPDWHKDTCQCAGYIWHALARNALRRAGLQ